MAAMKRTLAAFLGAALILGAPEGALAAAGKREAGELTVGIYATAGVSGISWRTDPLTGEEREQTYPQAAWAAQRAAEETEADLFVDLGNAPGDLFDPLGLGREPMAVELRLSGSVFLPGSREEEAPREERERLEEMLTAREGGGYPGQPVQTLWAGGKEPYAIFPMELGAGQISVGIVPLEKAGQWERTLRETEGCDLIVAAAPSGTWERDTLEQWAARTETVDLILVGTGDQPAPDQVKNAAGRQTPVAGGKGATQIKITVRGNGSLAVGQGKPLEQADWEEAWAQWESVMEPYRERITELTQGEIGVLAGKWDERTDPFQGQSDAMTLLQEARLWRTGAELSLTACSAGAEGSIGGLLDGQKEGSVSLRDCYTLYSSQEQELLVAEMTGLELKDWLERCAGRYTVGEDGAVTGAEGIDQLYGISYEIYLGNPEGDRIRNMTYGGEGITANQTFTVAVDASRIAGSGEDDYGWYEATGIGPDSGRIQREEDVLSMRKRSPAQLAAEYIKALSLQDRQITPPQARSRWSVSVSTSREALASVSRMDFVSALHRAAGEPAAAAGRANFSDAPQTGPASSALDWAVEAGVVQGNGGGLFLPDAPITREQAVVMLLRFDISREKGPGGSWATAVPYTDAANVATWASEALMWNVSQDYLSPDDGGNFRPGAAVTAAELERTLEKLERQ